LTTDHWPVRSASITTVDIVRQQKADHRCLNVCGLPSVGVDLKELGGQMSKCLKFYPGIKI